MAKGGKRNGAGRPKGSPNKRTIEREDLATQIAVRDLRSKPLAKELIETFMHIAAGYASTYQPREGNDRSSMQLFEKWARLAVSWACDLAPYQSPTFRAIIVAPNEAPSRGAEVLHTMEEVRREMLAAGVKPEMLARALKDDDGEPLDGEIIEGEIVDDE